MDHIPEKYNYLLEYLPEMTFVNATCTIETLRMIKSPAEISNMRDTAALADYSYYNRLLAEGTAAILSFASFDLCR